MSAFVQESLLWCWLFPGGFVLYHNTPRRLTTEAAPPGAHLLNSKLIWARGRSSGGRFPPREGVSVWYSWCEQGKTWAGLLRSSDSESSSGLQRSVTSLPWSNRKSRHDCWRLEIIVGLRGAKWHLQMVDCVRADANRDKWRATITLSDHPNASKGTQACKPHSSGGQVHFQIITPVNEYITWTHFQFHTSSCGIFDGCWSRNNRQSKRQIKRNKRWLANVTISQMTSSAAVDFVPLS